MVLDSWAFRRSYVGRYGLAMVHLYSGLSEHYSVSMIVAYCYPQTRTLVRVECIITQLIFEHSLRVRFKAETEPTSSGIIGDNSPLSTPNSESTVLSPSPEDGSSMHTPTSAGGSQNDISSQDGTLQASSSSVKSRASSRDKKSMKPPNDTENNSNASSGQNLVGKINNLITTDLGNIVEARDFLMAVIYIPLQITLCIVFLYAVLGWR